MDRASFGIIRTVNEPPDAGVSQRAHTHCTRFNCNKQIAVSQPVVTKSFTRRPKGYDFRMCRRITIGNIAVPTSAHDLHITNYDGPDRHVAHLKGALGSVQGLLHPQFVGRSGGIEFVRV